MSEISSSVVTDQLCGMALNQLEVNIISTLLGTIVNGGGMLVPTIAQMARQYDIHKHRIRDAITSLSGKIDDAQKSFAPVDWDITF